MKPTMIQLADLPAADAVIDYGEAGFGPVFLHWMPDGGDIGRACSEQGFECHMAPMEFDLEPEHPLFVSYFEQGETRALREWEPDPPTGDGWKLVGLRDTEEGPVALFIRKLPQTGVG